jgi:hypothetical protein
LEVLEDIPLVFHIGMHKTGTTWLQNSYFSKNKDFNLLNDTIEPWNDDLLKEIISVDELDFNIQKVRKIIKSRFKDDVINIVSAERLSGHPVSGGYDMEKIANRISKISSKIKILITTREVNSFIKSVYKQMVREGYCGTDHDFLFNNNWKTINTSKDYFLQKKIQDIYKEIFKPSNVLTLTFEEFKSNKKEFITKIENFLELLNKFDDKKTLKLVNKSYSNKRIRAVRVLNKFRKTELNPFPIINIGSKLVFIISKPLAVLFSNKELINNSTLIKYKS